MCLDCMVFLVAGIVNTEEFDVVNAFFSEIDRAEVNRIAGVI